MTPEEIIEQNLGGPKKVQIGNESVEQNALPEQIAAAEFLANQTANPRAAIQVIKLRSGGALC